MIPELILKGLLNYRDKRIPTGDFLYAVLTNNLIEAVGRADADSLAALREICAWVYWDLPSAAWRTPEKVAAWLKAGEKEEFNSLPGTDPDMDLSAAPPHHPENNPNIDDIDQ